MRSLDEILTRRKEIDALVHRFNFADVRIVYNRSSIVTSSPIRLTFLVRRLPDKKSKLYDSTHCETLLIHLLHCKVRLLTFEGVHFIFKKSIIRDSARIDNEEEIKRLFGVTYLSEINLKLLSPKKLKEHQSYLEHVQRCYRPSCAPRLPSFGLQALQAYLPPKKNLGDIFKHLPEMMILAERFKFSPHIRVYSERPLIGTCTTPLILIMEEIEDHPTDFYNAFSLPLAAKFSYLLECHVIIYPLKPETQGYWYGFLEKSVPIENTDALCNLFGVTSITEVFLENSTLPSRGYLRRANQYLLTGDFFSQEEKDRSTAFINALGKNRQTDDETTNNSGARP